MKKSRIAVLLMEMAQPLQGTVREMQIINCSYIAAVERAGGIPVAIPVTACAEDAVSILELCDGLLLPGGPDVDPRLYGEEPSPLLGVVNYPMDCLWAAVFREAVKRKMPVLGICRGMQLVNAAAGGTLYQDISLRDGSRLTHQQPEKRDYPLHKVTIRKGSALADLLGCEEVWTNTFHHQCVKDMAPGFTPSAWAGDGVIEAAENEDGSILLVQWHPENLLESVPCMNRLFEQLVEKAAKHQKASLIPCQNP